MKMNDIFLILAQNIHCRCLDEAVLMSNHYLSFVPPPPTPPPKKKKNNKIK